MFFDGPHFTRVAISTVIGVSALVPLIAAALHVQMDIIGTARISYIPMPSLRINIASVAATAFDLVFLAMAWEYLGKPNLNLKLWLRAFLTLLGVMWLDVIIFGTLAFAGTPGFWNIIQGTLVSRFIVSVFALPFLYGYIRWQSKLDGVQIENRPVLAILKQVAEVRFELSQAQEEIQKRIRAEAERDRVIAELTQALAEVKTLRGLLPICANCKKIRDDNGFWNQLEIYLSNHTEVEFSHGLCPECVCMLYPDLYPKKE